MKDVNSSDWLQQYLAAMSGGGGSNGTVAIQHDVKTSPAHNPPSAGYRSAPPPPPPIVTAASYTTPNGNSTPQTADL